MEILFDFLFAHTLTIYNVLLRNYSGVNSKVYRIVSRGWEVTRQGGLRGEAGWERGGQGLGGLRGKRGVNPPPRGDISAVLSARGLVVFIKIYLWNISGFMIIASCHLQFSSVSRGNLNCCNKFVHLSDTWERRKFFNFVNSSMNYKDHLIFRRIFTSKNYVKKKMLSKSLIRNETVLYQSWVSYFLLFEQREWF